MIICSNKDEEKFHIISKLHMYRRHYDVPSDVAEYQQYLQQHFVMNENPDHQTKTPVMAAQVDYERCVSICFASLSYFNAILQFFTRSCVRVVTSTRAGMGKSLYISRMAEQLQKLNVEGAIIETIPIHGPHVTTDTVMECLDAYQDSSSCIILHFDIAPSVCL